MTYLKFILAIIILLLGLVIGVIFDDIPNLKLNTEVKVFEPLTFLLTISIGILIPFFIKRWIEDDRHIKNNLIEELKDTLREVAIIKDKMKFCYRNKSITQSDKQEINVLFEQADLRINSLNQQFIESYDKETKTFREEITTDYMTYWKLSTCAEIMSDKFKSINENFYSRHNECFGKFETKIKQVINKVQRL